MGRDEERERSEMVDGWGEKRQKHILFIVSERREDFWQTFLEKD